MPNDKIQLGGSAGGIVEEGSNANGSWTKWDTGLMICSHEFSYSAPNAAVGSIFNSTEQSWTYPQTFTNNPQVSMNDADSTIIWFCARTIVLTEAEFSAMCYVSVSGARTVKAVAIGRWK